MKSHRGLSPRVRQEVSRELEILFTRIRVQAYLYLIAANFYAMAFGQFPYWREVLALDITFGMTAFIPWLIHKKTGRTWVHQAVLAQAADLSLTFCLAFYSASGDPKFEPIALAHITGGTAVLIAMSGLRLNSGLRLFTTVAGAFDLALFCYFFPATAQITLFNWVVIAFLVSMAIEHVVIRAAERSALSRFLPKDVAERIASDPMGLEPGGTSLEATILFTDMRNFTSLSERMNPHEIMDLLNRLHALQVQAVFDQGGMVNKFLGDGMLAVFGAPKPLENDADKALNAARAIVVEVAKLNSEFPDLRIGAGLHRGRVVAGNVGSAEQLEYTVIGDTVNVASRLESATKELGVDILFSQQVREALHQPLTATALGEIQVKGRSAAIDIFTPAG